MELDVLYAHIESVPVVAGFPALARRIAYKELPHGANIIVGVHERLLKERRSVPPTPTPPVPPTLFSPPPVNPEPTRPPPFITTSSDTIEGEIIEPPTFSAPLHGWGCAVASESSPIDNYVEPESAEVPKIKKSGMGKKKKKI